MFASLSSLYLNTSYSVALLRPNILALSPTLLPSLTLYTLLLVISLSLLTYFHFATREILRSSLAREGTQGKQMGKGWGVVMGSFALTVMYLPVGSISLHALVGCF